jgi:hypothetical protein
MSMRTVECDPESHKNHLCVLAERKQMVTIAQLAKDGTYFCGNCGRVATEAINVCSPMKLSEIV